MLKFRSPEMGLPISVKFEVCKRKRILCNATKNIVKIATILYSLE